ncbi:MAG: DUF4105 domain-containing protein [Polyangiaceae bacterium]
MRARRALLVTWAALTLATLLWPHTASAATPGDEFTVWVLTMGPGDHPFFKFGHNALLIEDRLRRRQLVYNFGTFDFQSPTLLRDFMKGRLEYWLSVGSLDTTLDSYRRQRRSVDGQELDLTPAERRALVNALEVNALPEHRAYRYDYYRDNCSTRVRDAIDRIVGGRLRDSASGPARMTWRAHTLRLTADRLFLSMGLDLVMGDVIDRPITEWDEMFLPSRLQEGLREVTRETPDGPVPLVAREASFLRADRPALRSTPPNRTAPMLAVGLALGCGLTLLGRLGSSHRAARVAFGLLVALMGVVLGLLGWVFLTFWIATDHVVAHHNENLLQCAPWALALVVAGPALAMNIGWGVRLVARLTAWTAVVAALALIAKALPWFDQHNGEFIALLLPTWIGAALGSRALSAASREPSPRT